MFLTVLADIKCRSMEAEQLHLTDQLFNVSIRDIVGIVMTQAAVNDVQIIDKFLRCAVTFRRTFFLVIQYVLCL
ncbi:hypothetical protein D3C75_1026280 [compost metagenome]